ncbi:uncharacterized protein F4822DRAFT_138348 [Hypoxylon trugodes]|uniref:uncharacterized protein n=1 Tax=Hypoxylon trugodes TaxID=326681 RepID=UPI0021983A89|nr:uncharacterized protein F4822DRAFT_138348 [Hypoxylon trugodes]KAI1392699.1 hypothetical protein F4822DRAFT_138348 [Hypoxylon trugodes]
MAIQSEIERHQSSSMTTNYQTKNEQNYQRHWLQLISNQPLETAPIPNQPLLVPVSNLITIPSHEDRVQWFACRLSKRFIHQYLNVMPVQLPLLRGNCHLELLPQDIIDRICRYVPYEDLISLYRLSRTMNQVIDPQLAPHETKLSFVLRAERDFPQHFTKTKVNPNSPRLGCYMCFRVLSGDVFDSDQPVQALLRTSLSDEQVIVNLRRFCIPCGIQSGCHNPGDKLVTRNGGRYWICDCLNVLDDKTAGCKNCRTLCPLSPRGFNASALKMRSMIWG